MKHACALTAGLAYLLCSGSAQAQNASPELMREIQIEMDGYWKAFQAKDTVALKRILAPEYSIYDASTRTNISRHDVLVGAMTATERRTGLKSTLHDGRLFGDVLVVHNEISADAINSGKPVDDVASVMLVFAKRGGRWVAVAGHTAVLMPTQK